MMSRQAAPISPFGNDRRSRTILLGVVLIAVVVRIAAIAVLRQPLEGDSLNYFVMAHMMASRHELVDAFGLRAFFSAGYPFLLLPFFLLLGSSVATALLVNLICAAVSVVLVFNLTLRLSRRRDAALLAALGFALWLPAIWNATLVAKENLSTPLVLALALCALRIADGRRPIACGFLVGLIWAAGVLTGGSSILLCGGVAVALIQLWRRERRLAVPLRAGLLAVIGAALILAPWLYRNDRAVGAPVLSTNAAFNLYIGNNPAADGRFVSMAKTPMGRNWNATRLALGELASTDLLKQQTLAWIAANPGKTAGLAVRKLGYFWQPDLPDAADFARSRALGAIRLIEVLQYLAIVVLGALGLASPVLAARDRWVLLAMIGGFWVVHAAAYIIPRYRDPIIPLLIVAASIRLVSWLQATARRVPVHAL